MKHLLLLLVMVSYGGFAKPFSTKIDTHLYQADHVMRLEAGVRSRGPCSKQTLGNITAPDLDEISGIGASRKFPGTFYVHNDSGAGPDLYRIDMKGQVVGKYLIQAAKAVDWEDLAVGPCPAGSCVYIADIGNNASYRKEFQIYVVPEGETRFDMLSYHYPKFEKFNAEAFAIDSFSKKMFVIRKAASGEHTLYLLPESRGRRSIEAVKICNFRDIGSGLVTSADIHGSGKRILVRTYSEVLEYEADGIDDERICRQRVRQIDHVEAQGEAIAYVLDSDDFVTASEFSGQPFHRFSCSGAPK